MVLAALRDGSTGATWRASEQEMRDRADSLAHFRHTLKLAEEQVEEVGEIDAIDERLGTPVTRYVFEGELFATRDEAEAARQCDGRRQGAGVL